MTIPFTQSAFPFIVPFTRPLYGVRMRSPSPGLRPGDFPEPRWGSGKRAGFAGPGLRPHKAAVFYKCPLPAKPRGPRSATHKPSLFPKEKPVCIIVQYILFLGFREPELIKSLQLLLEVPHRIIGAE